MHPSRREFLQIVGATGAATMDPVAAWLRVLSESPGLRFPGTKWPGISKYATTLRGVGPGGIPVAVPDGTSAITGAAHYSLRVNEFTDRLHPSLGPTALSGYSPSAVLG